jgi:hypothetical protein
MQPVSLANNQQLDVPVLDSTPDQESARGLEKPGSEEDGERISRACGPAGDLRCDLYLFTFVRAAPSFDMSATPAGGIYCSAAREGGT